MGECIYVGRIFVYIVYFLFANNILFASNILVVCVYLYE